MKRLMTTGAALVLALVTVNGSIASGERAPATPGGWVGTWATAPAAAVPNTPDGYPNYSIRNVVHTSIGGTGARVRLSNRFGSGPLVFGHVTVAVAAAPGSPSAVPGTMRVLTFGGAATIMVPAGSDVLSDPAPLTVPQDSDLLVTTYVPSASGPVTYHPDAQQTSFFTRTGDHSTETSGAAFTEQTSVWHYVTEVDVQNPRSTGSVVTLGDSITDGYQSTVGADHRWPDYLSDRLAAANRPLGVLNAGISANRLLLDAPGSGNGPNALARLDDDVLRVGDARTLIVLEGINDIQQDPHQTDPALLIAAYRQLIARAHARGIRVLGATITPFKGWQVYDSTLEATRQAANTFIRTSGEFDGVVDFDKAVRDPQDPLRMLPAYDSGDHLHPGDAGYRAMAAAVDLSKL
ncbi:MAG: hydrolase [Amycolatopsis sp.]|jgi:lysophospholipase L1-like esterase|uniref:SGNH/GDSL hydrolase family protein n=1 Tax=Amycolatopsis sp. TaxID=37632 RepID=UPI00261A7F5F|nr:SGNH/GDSL hydrolase family protein [Amycolatopsis sp.]MCU1684502.1 hydrolase [Amycolatopsis sp.]